MLHRYWAYLYNHDFENYEDFEDDFYKSSIIKAMDIVDMHLEKLIKVSEEFQYNIIITSSMGQKARDTISYDQDIILSSVSKLFSLLGLNSQDYEELPAMQPDVCIKCSDKKSLDNLRSKIKHIKDFKDEQIIFERYKPVDLNLNISLKMTEIISINKKIKIYEKEKESF